MSVERHCEKPIVSANAGARGFETQRTGVAIEHAVVVYKHWREELPMVKSKNKSGLIDDFGS